MYWLSSGKIEIDPKESVYLGCGPKEPVDPDCIIDNLEANVIIIWNEHRNSKVVVISVDSLFLGNDVSGRICSGLSGVFRQEEIFLAASHTHSAPMIDETKPRLGKRNDAYAETMVARIIGEVLRLAAETPTALTS